MIAIISGAINVFDSFVERLLCNFGSGCVRFAVWLQLVVLLAVLTLGVLSIIYLML